MEAASGRQAFCGKLYRESIWFDSPNWAAIIFSRSAFGDQFALQALRGHASQLHLPAARFTRYRDESHSVES